MCQELLISQGPNYSHFTDYETEVYGVQAKC